MSDTAVAPTPAPSPAPTQAPRQHVIPKSGLNPHVAPNLACPARGCHSIFPPKRAEEDPATGQLIIYYECPKCLYAFRLSPEYAQGNYSAPGKASTKLPEVGSNK